MNRWQAYGKRDTQLRVDGDAGFKGINMLYERDIIGPGFLARAENKRLRDGPAATRAGTGFPGDFNPAYENTLIGSDIYSNPNNEEVMLVAPRNSDHVWQVQFGKDPVKINLYSDVGPPGPQSTGGGLLTFVQAFDKVLMYRIPVIGPTLVWDGNVANKFNPIALSSTGLKLVPTTWTGEAHENRVLHYFPYGFMQWRTQFIVSDTLDYSSYDNIFGAIRVAAAKADHITRLLGYQKGSLIAFMRNSTRMVENFTVDPNQTTQRTISHTVGSAGIKMPLSIGREVFFLNEPGGFYKITEVEDSQIASEPIPISRAIQKLIERINWPRQHLSGCSASLGDYAFFGLCLDQKAGACDGIAVLNTASQQWESAPDWWLDANFRIDALHVTKYGNARRLFGLDYAAMKVYLLYDGVVDNINGNFLPVHDLIETRGYVCGDAGGFKKFERSVVGIRTSAPSIQVTALTDGQNEEYPLALITKDRTQSYLHGRVGFDPVLADPKEPKRQDYSIGADPNFAIEDFELLPAGDITFLPATQLSVEVVKQQSLEPYEVRQTGRWLSIRVENTSGQADILGVGVEGIPIGEAIKTMA